MNLQIASLVVDLLFIAICFPTFWYAYKTRERMRKWWHMESECIKDDIRAINQIQGVDDERITAIEESENQSHEALEARMDSLVKVRDEHDHSISKLNAFVAQRWANSIWHDTACVTCDECGCFMDRRFAIKGEDKIRYCDVTRSFDKEVHTPYYCKRCAPKKGKAK